VTSPQDDPGFLAGGGEMGALIRAKDWAATPLGPPSDWPQGLKIAVRLLLSTGHPMFIWWGPELVQFYNDAYRRSIGPERHPSALGQGGRECWAEIWPIIGPQIEQVMAGEGHTWHENQLVPITRNGRREDVYWTYSYGPIDDPDAPNGVGGVLVVCTETTEQVMTEQRLKAAEARWRRLFDQAPGFLCILRGPEHTFEFANPRYFELVGRYDILGKTVREALPEVASQGFIPLLDEVYRTGRAHSGVAQPISFRKEPGDSSERRYVDFVYQPIRDAGGEVTGILVDGYEVTDRVLAHQALRAEDLRKDEFLAMLAHELRNPLAPIRNATELLARTAAADSQARRLGELIARQADQLTRLVDDLLDVSRISQGLIELQREPLELGDAIEVAVETVQPLLRERRHEVSTVREESPLYVEGDMARLVQCLTNVLTNAAKYTEAGGHIEIALRRDGQSGIVEVRDDGAGISADMLPRVFDLFVQADRSLDRSRGGLGIGLSVARRLVEMHQGTITAISEGPGRGSTFRISLPLVDEPTATVDRPEIVAPLSARVLVVDDNVDAANSLAQLLELEGHATEAVYGGREALRRAPTFAPDIVLLDIGLPEVDGYEVARRLRADGSTALLVALTGYGQAEDVRRAHRAGFDAHVTKPIAFAELARLLREQPRRGGGRETWTDPGDGRVSEGLPAGE
jgi:signal transduction histidine kinase/CheY-like chemotaxis protein